MDINILPTAVGALNDFLQIEYIAAQQEDDFTRACKRCLQRVGILHRGDDRAARELIIELLFHIHPIPFHSIEGTIKIYWYYSIGVWKRKPLMKNSLTL